MKILIFGASGFIGRHLIKALVDSEHSLRLFMRPGSKQYEKTGIETVSGLLEDRDSVFEAVKGVDIIVHLASSVIPSTSNKDPSFDVSSNLVGAVNILDAAVAHKVKRIVFSSSGGTVYGAGSEQGFKEADPTNPICSYGVVKLAIEKYIQMYHHLYGLDYSILRISNPYGPGQLTGKPLGAVSVFIDRVLNNQPIDIWGDGEVKRDFIFISDVIEAIVLSMETSRASTLLNIGCGKPTSLNQLVQEISDVLNRKTAMRYHHKRDFDVDVSYLKIDAAGETLGWRPRVSLSQGILKTAASYSAFLVGIPAGSPSVIS